MIDPGAIAENAITSVVTQHVTKHLTGDDGKDVYSLLEEILTLAQVYFKKQEAGDIFRFVTVYKLGFGSPWNPSLMERSYQQVFSPVAATLNATGSLLPFNVNLPVADWKNLTFSDNTNYSLDPGYAGGNSLTLWVRLTNQNIF